MAAIAQLLPLALFVGGAIAYTCDPVNVRRHSAGKATIAVAPLCLGRKIAGTPGVNFFKGPSPMSAVADNDEDGTLYFSWTEDLPITRNEEGMNGRILVTKVTFTSSMSLPTLQTTPIDGFMRAGDIDITDEGIVGTMCAKHFPHLAVEFQQYQYWVRLTQKKLAFNDAFPDFRSWSGYERAYPDASKAPDVKNMYPEWDEWRKYIAWNVSARDKYSAEEHAPLVLAVCFVDTKTMQQRGTPQRIGVVWHYRKFRASGGRIDYNRNANYPYFGSFTQQGGGYGSLRWTPPVDGHPARWVGWWEAACGFQTGYAMHVMREDTARDYGLEAIIHNVPKSRILSGEFEPTVISRDEPEIFGKARVGTGDHQSGMMSRWHPGLRDIFHAKHRDKQEMYVQQFGLQGEGSMKGKFGTPVGGVHETGRVPVIGGRQEGAMRPCGPEMIMAYLGNAGVTCARFNNEGTFTRLKVLDDSVSSVDWKGKHVKLATLGSKEGAETTCDATVTYLLGYWTVVKRRTMRWLTEINGDCERLTEAVDVTAITTWPFHQEWTTTAEGAVAWVTAWPKREDGVPLFNQWGKKKVGENDGHGFTAFGDTAFPAGAASGSQEEAQLTMYWSSTGKAKRGQKKSKAEKAKQKELKAIEREQKRARKKERGMEKAATRPKGKRFSLIRGELDVRAL